MTQRLLETAIDKKHTQLQTYQQKATGEPLQTAADSPVSTPGKTGKNTPSHLLRKKIHKTICL